MSPESMVYMPRLIADTTFSPALFVSAITNSPGKRSCNRLVIGTMKMSRLACGALTITAGHTLLLLKSESG